MSREIYEGDDYLNAENRALTYSGDDWPDLTGGSVSLTVSDKNDVVISTLSGTVVTPGTGTQTIRFDYPNAETSKLTKGDGYVLRATATLSSTHHVTLTTENMLAK